MSSHDFSISKNGDSTVSLSNLILYLITLTVRNFLLCLNGSFWIWICAHCLLGFHRIPLRKVWLHILCSSIRYLYTVSASSCIRDATVPSPYLLAVPGLAPVLSMSFSHLGVQEWTQISMDYLLWRKVSGQTWPSLALPVVLLCVVGQCPGFSCKTPLSFFIHTQDMTELDLSFISSVRNILLFQKKLLLPVWTSGCRDGCVQLMVWIGEDLSAGRVWTEPIRKSKAA